MKGLNRAYLIGNLGQDPELRSTPSGKPYLKLSVATPHGRKVGEEWVETPDWHRLTLWGQTAEFVARYAKKGDLIGVECAIRQNKWTDKDNTVHYAVDLVVERVLTLHGKNRSAPTSSLADDDASSAGERDASDGPAASSRAREEAEVEIPF